MPTYAPNRVMVAYHWMAAIMMLLAALALGLYATSHPWPELRPWYAKAFFIVLFGTSMLLMLERAMFVTFTRARAAPEGLVISPRGGRERCISWSAVEAAETSSFDATPAGRLRVLRLDVKGRKVTIPLAKHPAEDELFAAIVERAGLAPTDPDWQADRRFGKSLWVRQSIG